MTDARKHAIELAQQAVTADQTGQLPDALKLYTSACTYFQHALRYDKSLSKVGRETVTAKCNEYLERAETLKKRLDDAQNSAREAEARADTPANPRPGRAGRHAGDSSIMQQDEEGGETGAESGTRLTEPPRTRWSDVAGLINVKLALNEAVVLPEKLPHFFREGHGRQVATGILLYGPPGTGKTLVARALAGESGRAFFSVSTADIMDKYVGESEQKLRRLFEEARAHRPSIIFVDEIETLCQSRGGSHNASEASQHVVSEFLRQLDGIGSSMSNVLLLGATNLPEALDSAMRRRFTKRLYVPLPNQSTRAAILRVHLKRVPSKVSEEEVCEIAANTEGYSAADLEGVVQHALSFTLHMVTEGTHFRSVPAPVTDCKNQANQEDMEDMEDIADSKEWWVPCSPGDPDARETSYADLPSDCIVEPPVEARYLRQALREIRPNVTAEECIKYETFDAQYGTGRA